MSNKKVLIFSTAYFPFVGGAEIAVKEITDRLGDEIQFDLITCRFNSALPRVERVGKVNVYRVGIGIKLVDKLLSPFLGAVKARQLHAKYHYDFFWALMATYTSGAAYIVNFFQKKVPTILTLQEGDSEKHLRYRWFGLIDLSWKLALARTDILTVISTYLLDRARRLGYKGKAEIIPNGVDTKKFESQTSHVAGEKTVLISTSRLVKKNGIEDVIDALALLPENVLFQIIGTGPLEQDLKAQVKRLKLENRVRFLGFIDQNKIPAYLHNADIFIRPSLSEGMGNSFIEAMAAGLPVIATSVGGIPDFLTDNETGIFCQPHNPQSIAEAVVRLTSDAALREKIVANAQAMVKAKYDWDLIAGEMKSKVFTII